MVYKQGGSVYWLLVIGIGKNRGPIELDFHFRLPSEKIERNEI
jgi:hypothetical protein